MKRLLTFSLISLLVCSCKQCAKTNKEKLAPINQEVIDFFFFNKKGSYWVFQDSITLSKDTLVSIYGIEEGYFEVKNKNCTFEERLENNLQNKGFITGLWDGFKIVSRSNEGVNVAFVNTIKINPLIEKQATVKIRGKAYIDVIWIKKEENYILWSKKIGPIKLVSYNKGIKYVKELIDYQL